ncbi:MAG: SDR family NAD(P)-dependent oxidoreductase [Mesorhizobium sp.]|nr:MAG: SDR family NAD(P)-dependent oxidoreductase [Mesorhizobium sp.]
MKALFSGKTVLITGALGTIGRAFVARYREEEARVIASDRPDVLAAQASVSPDDAGVTYFGCDLNDLAGTETSVGELVDAVGGIDILVNNAAYVTNKPHEEFSLSEYEEHMRVNSSAAFVLSRAVSRHMKAQHFGRIINLTSLTLTGHWNGFVPYVASKGAMYGLIKSFARELGPHGITVNGISPGAVVSDAEYRHFGDRREEYHRWVLERQSLKRRSSHADLITGQDIHVDGGW